MDKILDFKATPEKCVFNSDNFKIYGCSINSFEYPDIKVNKYNNVTIKGDISELNLGIEYTIKAKEISDSYGLSYQVINIKREKPTDIESSRNFLYEILTVNQTNTLLAVYPDIVDRVMKNRLDDIDLNKTKGIKQYTFEVIKKKIIDNFVLAELVDEFKGLFNISIIKKLYDEYTSVDKIKEEIRIDPYKCLCKLGGIGFKTADALLLTLYNDSVKCKKNGDRPALFFNFELPSSYQRAKSCVNFLLDENENNGNTYMAIGDLKKQFDTLVPEAKNNLGAILKAEDSDVVFDRERMSVCKKSTYETEKYVAGKIHEALKCNTKWNIDCSKYNKVDGFELTEEQRKTTEYVCKYAITLLIGYGGSGKSSSTKALINLLKDNHKTYRLFAPTGRAAKVLAAFTGVQASTIHRGLGFQPPLKWNYNEEDKLSCDIVIVDEFSMVDIFLFKHLIEAIDFERTKLLIIGDPAQLPSVGAGNGLTDLLAYGKIPTVTLNKVFRYGIGGLSTVATDVRVGRQYLNKSASGMQSFGEDNSYVFIPVDQTKMVDYVTKLYKGLITKGYNPEDIAVLSSYNVGDYGTVAINKRLQNAVNPLINDSDVVNYGDTEFRLNDVVTATTNDYKAVIYDMVLDDDSNETTFVANGESGKIIKVLKDAFVVRFDENDILVPKGQMGNYKLAYAISTHRSQGGQFKIVIVCTPRSHTYMLNANLLYVGISRAKEYCYHIGEIRTVNNALKKRENLNRKTLLAEFLNSMEN